MSLEREASIRFTRGVTSLFVLFNVSVTFNNNCHRLVGLTGIETALYFIFPEEDETIVCGTVEVKAVEDLFQMRFYPLSQPADSPFDQNLFADGCFVFYEFPDLKDKNRDVLRSEEIFRRIFVRVHFRAVILSLGNIGGDYFRFCENRCCL